MNTEQTNKCSRANGSHGYWHLRADSQNSGAGRPLPNYALPLNLYLYSNDTIIAIGKFRAFLSQTETGEIKYMHLFSFANRETNTSIR